MTQSQLLQSTQVRIFWIVTLGFSQLESVNTAGQLLGRRLWPKPSLVQPRQDGSNPRGQTTLQKSSAGKRGQNPNCISAVSSLPHSSKFVSPTSKSESHSPHRESKRRKLHKSSMMCKLIAQIDNLTQGISRSNCSSNMVLNGFSDVVVTNSPFKIFDLPTSTRRTHLARTACLECTSRVE